MSASNFVSTDIDAYEATGVKRLPLPGDLFLYSGEVRVAQSAFQNNSYTILKRKDNHMSTITHIAVGRKGTIEAGRVFQIANGEEGGDGSVTARDATRLRVREGDTSKVGSTVDFTFTFTKAEFDITKLADPPLREVSLAKFQNAIGRATAASGICADQAAKAAALGVGTYATRRWDLGEGCPATQAGFASQRICDMRVFQFGEAFDTALTALNPDIHTAQEFKVVA